MIKILILLAVYQHLKYVIAGKSNMLGCGLIGYSGSKKPDINMLKILGLYNMERGVDSTGIYNSQNTVKYLGPFSSLIEREDFIKLGEDNTTIMHTRKASVGVKTINNAHPFVFQKNDEPKFIFAHNGTLINWRAMLKERDMDVTKYDIDSKALGAIIFKENNFKSLSSYNGGAALLFHWKDQPDILYAFKGGGGNIEERPLYYMQIFNEEGKVTGVYLSSLSESLKAIQEGDAPVICIKNNELIKFNKGVIEESLSIFRSGELNSSIIYTPHHTAPFTGVTPNTHNVFITNLEVEDIKSENVVFSLFRYWDKEGFKLQGGILLNKATGAIVGRATTNSNFKALYNKLKPKYQKNVLIGGWYFDGVQCKSFSAYKRLLSLNMDTMVSAEEAKILSTYAVHPVMALFYNDNSKRFVSLNTYFVDGELANCKYTNALSLYKYGIVKGSLTYCIKNNINEDVVTTDQELAKDYLKDSIEVLREYFDVKHDPQIKVFYVEVIELISILLSTYKLTLSTSDEVLLEIVEGEMLNNE